MMKCTNRERDINNKLILRINSASYPPTDIHGTTEILKITLKNNSTKFVLYILLN